MRELDLAALMRKIVLRLNKKHEGVGSSVQLSLPLNLPGLFWHDRSLEKLIERIIHYASVISCPAQPVKIAVRQKTRLLDLEKFFDIHPSRWIQLRIELGAAGLEERARQILQDHGYRCGEWVEVENSRQQLGAFCLETDRSLKLVLWTENHRFSPKCALLIPVAESLCSSD